MATLKNSTISPKPTGKKKKRLSQSQLAETNEAITIHQDKSYPVALQADNLLEKYKTIDQSKGNRLSDLVEEIQSRNDIFRVPKTTMKSETLKLVETPYRNDRFPQNSR